MKCPFLRAFGSLILQKFDINCIFDFTDNVYDKKRKPKHQKEKEKMHYEKICYDYYYFISHAHGNDRVWESRRRNGIY